MFPNANRSFGRSPVAQTLKRIGRHFPRSVDADVERDYGRFDVFDRLDDSLLIVFAACDGDVRCQRARVSARDEHHGRCPERCADRAALSNLDKPPPKPNLPLPAGAARSSATSRMGPSGQVEIVAICDASTGGPQALQELLLNLVKPFPAPIVIVQHIATGFLPGMVDWLGQTPVTRCALRPARSRCNPATFIWRPTTATWE